MLSLMVKKYNSISRLVELTKYQKYDNDLRHNVIFFCNKNTETKKDGLKSQGFKYSIVLQSFPLQCENFSLN